MANKRAHLCFNKKRKMFLDLIAITKEPILAEKKQSFCQDAPTYKQRTFATPTVMSLSSNRPRYHAAAQTQLSGKARVNIPQGTLKENIHEIFDELTQKLKTKSKSHFHAKQPVFLSKWILKPTKLPFFKREQGYVLPINACKPPLKPPLNLRSLN